MSSAPTYHHGNLRASLVEAAVDLARSEGPAGIGLRETARRVGVSHNAAYRHFADLDELVAEVGVRGLAGLCAAMDRRLRLVAEDDAVRRARLRLAGLGRGYVDFALAEPGLFRVLFTAYADLPGDPHGGRADLPDPLGMLATGLDDLVEVGYLDPARRPGAEVMCWSAVHGFASLHVDGPLRGSDPRERDAALDHVLLCIDRSYGAPEPADPLALPG